MAAAPKDVSTKARRDKPDAEEAEDGEEEDATILKLGVERGRGRQGTFFSSGWGG